MRRLVIVVAVVAAALAAPLALAANAKTTELFASLTGKGETPKGAVRGTAHAVLKLNPATGRVCWNFTKLKALQGKPLASHIHKGKPGTAGAIVVPFGKAYKHKGCAKAKKSLVRAILRKPGNYYVNIHNAKFPGGAVRGQLTKKDNA